MRTIRPLRDERVPAVALTVLFFGACLWQLWRSLDWGHDSWQITEWLINYAGGFVRRGLPGEIVHLLSSASSVPANLIVITVSMAVFAALVVIIRQRTAGVLPFAVVCSPLLLGAAAYQDFIVRKEGLIILLLIACIHIASAPRKRMMSFIAVASIASAGMLIHESFLFVALAPLVSMFLTESRRSGGRKKDFPLESSLIAAILLGMFALLATFRGSRETAVAINDSWSSLWNMTDTGSCCLDRPSAAFDALGWSAMEALAPSKSVLAAFSWGIYVPLAWIVTVILVFWLVVQFVETGEEGGRGRMARILIVQLAFISPLFVLGWDFGRWIFLWSTSSVALFVYGVDFTGRVFGVSRKIAEPILSFRIFTLRPSLWLLLFLGIPGCCWTVYSFAQSSPAGFLISLLYTLTEVAGLL